MLIELTSPVWWITTYVPSSLHPAESWIRLQPNQPCDYHMLYNNWLVMVTIGQWQQDIVRLITGTIYDLAVARYGVWLWLRGATGGIRANTGNSPNVVLMLAQRLRRWPNIKTALGECPVLAGMLLDNVSHPSGSGFLLWLARWLAGRHCSENKVLHLMASQGVVRVQMHTLFWFCHQKIRLPSPLLVWSEKNHIRQSVH